MKILVTGKNGQLGSEIRSIVAEDLENQFYFTSSDELDLSNKKAIKDFFENQPVFDLIINCAAYTAVDRAEDETEKCYLVNTEAVKELVKYCSKNNSKLIHFSTDYVFDGSNNIPYIETDTTNPTGIYGDSKRKGEIEIINSSIDAIIIRTSWVYSTYGNNFVKTMLKLGKEKEQMSVVFDQIGTPTYAFDLANASIEIAKQIDNWKKGVNIYHYSNEGVTSWYDFASEIISIMNLTCKITPIETSEYPTKAKRPHFSVLNKKQIKKDFELEIPHWKSSLLKMLNQNKF
jgi:dTDP-4-dehydrorhamnose reductase